jgi:two-component system, OmpR family, phosphate regulon sensor histidine kinase PhoR
MSIPPKEPIFVITSEPQTNYLLERVLKSMGYSVNLCQDRASAEKLLNTNMPALVILGEKLNDSDGLEFAAKLLSQYPAVPLIMFVARDTPELIKAAIKVGVTDYLTIPLRADDIIRSVQDSLDKNKRVKDWVLLEARRVTHSLQRQIDELETLARLGRSITSSLDLDSVLSAVVDAAVELTGAEEGSLLLLDETSGELYMRAARNFQEEFVRTFRLPMQDSLAGSVLRTSQPVLLDEKTPKKIKTAYLVHSLIYVPLQIHGHVFGVLGVDNRNNRLPFKERDIKLLSALAEYAVIAIENAGLYAASNTERSKLETILTRIQDGVIVVGQDERLIMVNAIAQSAFSLSGQPLIGKQFREVFDKPEMTELIESSEKKIARRVEITTEDGRIFNTQIAPIPEVGMAITMHDITYLKKLDRIKSDFVNTVSHDLRSPLTAILGYAELIERAGPVTDLQRDFIRRVQISVHNITNLVNDLLNLGRIEAGFDTRKESVYIDKIIRLCLDGFDNQITAKKHKVNLEIPTSFPVIFANPVQLRQMFNNLIDNAVKYSPVGGQITIHGDVEQNQIILQIRDSGIGIPPMDLPFIFDKFYRASNASTESTGTGLGLSIVKSIVENHQGRIWVDSKPGSGTTFTIVLPLAEA